MKKLQIFTACIIVFLSVSCGEKDSALDELIQVENGVTVVRNPMEPIKIPSKPTGLALEKNLRIGTAEGDENYMFADVRSVQVDDEDNIIVLDSKLINIKVYDKDGNYIRTFLKSGQGPEEVGWPARMYMREGSIIVILDSRNRKYLEFSTEGGCLKEISLGEKSNIFRSWPDSLGNIYCETMDLAPDSQVLKIVKYDSEFKEAEELASLEVKRNMMEISADNPRLICSVRLDDKVIWANSTDYCLHILDPSGKLVKKIYKEYKPVPYTSEEKEEAEKRYKEMGLPSMFKLVFPKGHPAMSYVVSDDRGRTYVCTAEKNEERQVKWDVFDEEGRYILSFFHQEDEYIFVIKNDQVYTICSEDEEGIPHMTRYTLKWQYD
jgi:hypothetical protein